MTVTKKMLIIACAFVFCAGADAFGQKAGDKVTFYATVTDKKGGIVEGLTADSFKLSDGKAEGKIVSFSDKAEPMSIGFLIDVSESMGFGKMRSVGALPALLSGLGHLVGNAGAESEFFAGTVGENINIFQDLTKDKDRVKTALGEASNVTHGKQTALYDGIAIGLKKLASARHSKKVLIVLSDGQDSYSRIPFSELKKMAKNSDVLIYTFLFMPLADYARSLGMAGTTFMTELSRITGGRVFDVLKQDKNAAKNGQDVFTQLANELNKQYALTFESGIGKKKDDWREVEVDLLLSKERSQSLGKPSVRSRQVYLVTGPGSQAQK